MKPFILKPSLEAVCNSGSNVAAPLISGEKLLILDEELLKVSVICNFNFIYKI
jgi:hypothetical protein